MNLKNCSLLSILILLWAFPPSAIALDATAIVNAIQKQYDATDTFEARFVQKSYLKILDFHFGDLLLVGQVKPQGLVVAHQNLRIGSFVIPFHISRFFD